MRTPTWREMVVAFVFGCLTVLVIHLWSLVVNPPAGCGP